MTTTTNPTSDSIAFTCPCGARGKAPAEVAGRKIRCRRCGETLRLPSSRFESATPVRASSRAVEKLGRGEKRVAKRSLALHNRDLDMEGHLRAIGLWSRALGLLSTILSVLSLPVAGLMGPVFVAWSGATMVCGHGLLRFEDWGRKGLGALSALSLVFAGLSLTQGGGLAGVVFGATWNAAVLWALYNARSEPLFSVKAAAARSQEEKPASYLASPFFWVPVVGLLIGVMAAFGTR